MIPCKNCGHQVLKNAYGGWLHAKQWRDYCAVSVCLIFSRIGEKKEKECGCTIPIG